MIIDDKNKQILMETRDINFIIPQYIRQYLFVMRNEDPIKIVFPKFLSAPHPHKPGVKIPIEYIDIDTPLAAEITKNGSNVPEQPLEVTPEAQADLAAEIHKQSGGEDEEGGSQQQQVKEDGGGSAKQQDSPIGSDRVHTTETMEVKTDLGQPPRQPKQPPGGDIGSGHPDDMQDRDTRLDSKIAADLKPEPQTDEGKEIPTKIDKPE